MTVRVTFDYEPDEPDDGDRTGVSADEHERLLDSLMQLGAENVTVEKKP